MILLVVHQFEGEEHCDSVVEVSAALILPVMTQNMQMTLLVSGLRTSNSNSHASVFLHHPTLKLCSFDAVLLASVQIIDLFRACRYVLLRVGNLVLNIPLKRQLDERWCYCEQARSLYKA